MSLFPWLKTRAAGVLLHPTSLPGPTGIGTFGSYARDFILFLSNCGIKYWQVCPLGPTGYGDSPYQCFSAFAGNPYLIDLESLVEEKLLQEPDLGELRKLAPEMVDYGAQWILRWPVLLKAYQNFIDSASNAARKEFSAFKKINNTWLQPFARFVALKGRFQGKSWLEWPSDCRFYAKSKKAVHDKEFEIETDAQAWYQFAFFRQWLRLKQFAHQHQVQIIGDIPIFVSMDSADVWTNPGLFQMNRKLEPTGVAGVPPDYFAEDGQLWGNPLYAWEKHQDTGYAWWLARLRSSFELYDVLRIDHFRGFEAYCCIPATAINARHFEWIKGPGLELFVAIQKSFPEAKLIAEDLGVITDPVRTLVAEVGAPGMKVMQFGFEGATEYLPHSAIPNSVLYPGTHDNDTAIGWFSKQPEGIHDFFRRYLRVPGHTPGWDMIRAGYASACNLFIAPLQDFMSLGSEARLNTPGQAAGNWHWRFTSEQLERLHNEAGSHLKELAELYQR
ncbi:MAG: 4-alpha-glucanotransferase [Verrucomicrobia bacterium]|nr:4-alpha-glucanotransferase [Verrucomicrobiota bacterium]